MYLYVVLYYRLQSESVPCYTHEIARILKDM